MPLTEFESEVENNKNKRHVFCKNCKSKILLPMSASYVSHKKMIPMISQKKNFLHPEEEELSDFWLVEDMYTFENIGFTLTKDDIKYLSCADCEMGPIGYHNISTKNSYVALARIEHKN